MEWTWFLCPRGRSKWVDYSSKSPFAPALARRSRRGREINIHLSTTSSIESRARVRAVDDAPSLVVHERPSREGSSRRHVGGHVRDQRRARARSMRVEIRAKCANNLYQRTFQSISPSVHELAFEDVSRVDINQRRRCDVHGVHLVLTPGARARAWWDFLFFMKRRFDDKILH